MEFRIGINMGDVVVEGDNLYGDGVNIAARLEALAQANGVCISRSVHEFINKKLEILKKDVVFVSYLTYMGMEILKKDVFLAI